MNQPNCNCLRLLRQLTPCALALALAKLGSNMAARIAMIAMTTNNSIRVKPAFSLTAGGFSARLSVIEFIEFPGLSQGLANNRHTRSIRSFGQHTIESLA